MRAFSEDAGKTIGSIISHLYPYFDSLQFSNNLDSNFELAVEAEDYKSPILYKKVNKLLGLQDVKLAALFLSIVSRINFVHKILRRLLPPKSNLYFRFKFITVFHMIKSYRLIGSILKDDTNVPLKQLSDIILKRKNLRKIRRKDHLRNAMAHYSLNKIDLSDTNYQNNIFQETIIQGSICVSRS